MATMTQDNQTGGQDGERQNGEQPNVQQQQGGDRDRQQQQQDDLLDNNRGGADPTGGQVIREGGGPGENIEPRPGERMDDGEPGEDGRQNPDDEGMSQSGQEPAEGPRSEEEGRGQDR